MKLIVKTLKQISYIIEIDENETVENLKKKVEIATKNELSSTTMNLIFAGKVLENDKTLKYYNINGNRFIVAMSKSITKNEKVKVDKATSPRASSYKEEETLEDQPKDKDNSETEGKLRPIDENAASSLENYSGTETITDPAKIEEVIDNISSMGYSTHEVRRAFLAACNNPERTVEYLVNGCPPHLDEVNPPDSPIPSPQPGDLWYIDPAELELRRERERRELNEWMRREQEQHGLENYEQRDTAGGTPPNTLASSRNQSNLTMQQNQINNRVSFNNVQRVPLYQGNNVNEINPDNIRNVLENIRGYRENNPQRRYQGYDIHYRNQNHGNGNGSPFAFLRSEPRFIQMRQLIRSNPDFMRALLLDISQNNVDLLEMINDNQEAFLQLINENPNEIHLRAQNGQALRVNGNAIGVNGNAVGVNGSALAAGQVRLSETDRDAIERLGNLGFTEELCLEAYLACEKNEELAANYLCSQNFDNH